MLIENGPITKQENSNPSNPSALTLCLRTSNFDSGKTFGRASALKAAKPSLAGFQLRDMLAASASVSYE